jgi:O-antigen ligase
LTTAAALLVLPRPSAAAVIGQVRWWLAVYVYGSLLAALVDPSWALVPVPSGVGTPIGQPRLYGLSDHPNHLAPLAALLIVLEMATRGPLWRRLAHVMAGAAVILLTGTLTALVCVVVALGSLEFARRRRAGGRGLPSWRAALAAVIAAVLAVAALAVVRPDIGKHWRNIFTGDGRITIWRAAVRVWVDYPLLGYGPHVFDQQAQLRYLGPHTANLDSAHSQYLQAFAQGGVLLGAALLIYVAALLLTARRSAGPLGAPEATALCLVLLTSMATEVVLRVSLSSSFYLMQMSVVLVLATQKQAGRRQRRVSADGATGGGRDTDSTGTGSG